MPGYFTSLAVLVLGMHRSGTSAVTRLIGALGADLPADPNPPAPDNPEGYWESAGLVALNDRLLYLADSAWLDLHPVALPRIPPADRLALRQRMDQALAHSFGTSRCFVVKDPRICGLVSWYRDLLGARGAGVRVVLVLRHPAAVAASLFQRDQISNVYASLLWARHLIEAERATRDLPRVVVDYDELLSDWQRTARRIAPLLDAPPDAALHVPAEARPRLELRHHHHDATHAATPAGISRRSVSPAAVEPLFTRLYDALLALREHDTADTHAIVDTCGEDALAMRDVLADALDAEFRVQRLTSPYDTVAPLDPTRERAALAAAFGRLHRAHLTWSQDARG